MSEQRDQSIQLLKDAQNALALYEDSKNNYDQLCSEAKQLSKDYASENKALESDIAAAIKRERAVVESQFSSDLKHLENDLKKARARKDKVRTKSVKKRIKSESAPIEEENSMLKEASRSELKKAGISPIFNTPAFYQLIAPKGIGEFLMLAVVFALIGFCIPGIIYLLIPERKLFHFVILCIIFIALMIIIYVFIYKATKGKNKSAILHARKNYDLICVNKKKMRALVRSIETEDNDSAYNLDDLNESLNKMQEKYDQLRAQYDEALQRFENQKRPVIDADLRSSYGDRLNQIQVQISQKSGECDNAKQLLAAAASNLEENYNSIIGKKYMKADTLAKLETIITEYQAETIEEAIEVLKTQK